MMIRYSWRKNM